jgi:hypothetical protein
MPRPQPGLNNSDDVSSQASRNTGHASVPQARIYVPNYHGVNQVLAESGGQGEVDFYSSLARQSKKTLEDFIAVNNEITSINNMIDAQASTDKDAREYLDSNPKGEGYMQFVTSKYKEHVQQAIESAQDPEVQQKIKLYSVKNMQNLSNSAMKIENELRTAYALAQTEENRAALLVQLRRSPDLVESLAGQYESISQTIQKIAPLEYAKHQNSLRDDFAMTYARGRIDKDPDQALSMLNTQALGNQLSQEKLSQLKKEAESEIAYREAQLKQKEREEEHIKNQIAATFISSIRRDAVFGIGNPMRKIAEGSGIITERQRNELEIYCHHQQEVTEKKQDTQIKLDMAVASKQSAPLNISTTAKNDHFYDYIESENIRRDGEGNKPMSLTEIVQYAQDNSLVYDANIPSLKQELVTTITSSKEPAKIMDGCIALGGDENIPALKGIDKECVDFANLAVVMFRHKKSLNDILIARDEYFSVDRNTLELNKSTWKTTNYARNRESAVESFLKNNKFMDSTLFGLITSIPETHRDYLENEAYRIIKRVYERTGSLTKAENVAAQYLHNIVKQTDVNGKTQWMINPPDTSVTGEIPIYARNNLIAGAAQEIIETIQKAGDNYQGSIKVRLKTPLISKANINDVFSKPLNNRNRKIEAYIGGKWEERQLFIDSIPGAYGNYGYYIEVDGIRDYLINPNTGKIAIVNLSAKNIANMRSK